MKHLLSKPYAPIVAVIWNILLVYVVYQIARLAYFFENAQLLHYNSDVFSGGLLFDTSAIVYTNALYVVLMIAVGAFTLKGQKALKWLYLIINGLALAINLTLPAPG